MNAAEDAPMGKWLNVLIVVLLIAWIMGLIFKAVFGLLIHLLLVIAVAAIIMKIYLWLKRDRRKVDAPRT